MICFSCKKVVRGGEVLKCGVSMTTRAEYGTEVFVRNFMFNQPVRQKQAINSKYVPLPTTIDYFIDS